LYPHGGLPADRAVRDVVEVLGEDPELPAAAGMDVLEVLGELGLADLALERAFALARVEVATAIVASLTFCGISFDETGVRSTSA
jgi:hypothetical protein